MWYAAPKRGFNWIDGVITILHYPPPSSEITTDACFGRWSARWAPTCLLIGTAKMNDIDPKALARRATGPTQKALMTKVQFCHEWDWTLRTQVPEFVVITALVRS